MTGGAAGEHPLTSTHAKCQQFFTGNLHSFDQNVNMLALPRPSMKINILGTTFLLSPHWASRWGGAGPQTPPPALPLPPPPPPPAAVVATAATLIQFIGTVKGQKFRTI